MNYNEENNELIITLEGHIRTDYAEALKKEVRCIMTIVRKFSDVAWAGVSCSS